MDLVLCFIFKKKKKKERNTISGGSKKQFGIIQVQDHQLRLENDVPNFQFKTALKNTKETVKLTR